MKNGFTKTQNDFIRMIETDIKNGISFTSSISHVASAMYFTEDYVLDTFLSYKKMRQI